MNVITLTQDEFDAACFKLADVIIKDCKPVAIVGVHTGGAVVAELVCAKLREESFDIDCLSVVASRNSSNVKRKINVAHIFSLLPWFFLNALRKFEHYYLKLTMMFRFKQDRNVRINNSTCSYLERLPGGCVCIIDDAIDSGATIRSLLDNFRLINPKLDYKVAVLVVTQSSPLVYPDTFLYSNVLLRFPWSSDYK